ncbi:DUF6538 domain-containing protein [Hansschlegelia quercus]|uniref:Integrase n=1 Tax=Hansschlegelia quercus TaxID=2528245 RepID=A0A4Q9GGR1_9HYPH|nr:DUF6538 domain-containing protein [Hansschlegelia quercus]TBN47675.1 integrase [Hansschlegelia quercus]
MIRPTKHPRTGIYRVRGRYPAELFEVYGKAEFKVSLGTRDPEEARVQAPVVLAELEKKWRRDSLTFASTRAETAGREPIDLTRRQIEALAGEIYRNFLKDHEDDPGDPGSWKGQLDEELRLQDVFRKSNPMNGWQFQQRRWSSVITDHVSQRGLVISLKSRQELGSAVFKHMQAAQRELMRKAEGDFSPDDYEKRFPSWEAPAGNRTLEAIFEPYAREAELAPSTRNRFKSVIRRLLVEHIKRDDFGAITSEKLISWKNKLLEEGLAPRTIRDVHLAAIKAACNWAVSEQLLAANPAVGVKIIVKKRPQTRTQKGYTLGEALTVLTAAAGVVDDGRLFPDRYAARRWVPWICAYTGARVNEITQMRAEDIFQAMDEEAVDPIWMFHITPEAGSIKNGMPRDVAVHKHLIDQGFIEFARSVGRGPLFYDPARARGGSAVHPIYKKTGERLAAWVRELGINDPELQPNHGWRHRFKTICVTREIEEAVIHQITGHSETSEGRKYGDIWPSVSKAAMDKIPRFAIETPPPRRGLQVDGSPS